MPRLNVLRSEETPPPNAAHAAAGAGLPALSEPEREEIARELANLVEGEVRFGLHDRMLYATDASLYQVEPLGVVVPSSVVDAERVVRFCAERGLPVLPRGGGTSLAGQCTNRAVVVDFSAACRAVGEVDADGRRVRVEPGITLDELNEEIARRGHRLFFGPDVATSRHANIGGMIGNNSAGARSILYGRTVENVLAIDALVMNDRGGADRLLFERGAAGRDSRVRALTERVCEVVGRHAALIRERFPKTVRRVDGYNLDLILHQMEQEAGDALANVNLASLLCGAEGTLAVTLGATLKLVPLPKSKGLAVIGFETLDGAMAAVNPILATRPSAVELLDDMVIDLARKNTEYRRYVDLLPAPPGGRVNAVLYVEYFAEGGVQEVEERFAELRRLMPDAPMAAYTDAKAMAEAWKLRKAGEPLLHGVPGHRKPLTFVEDTAVDPTVLPRFVKDFRDLVARHGTTAAFYAHASVGCLHIRPMLDLRSATDRDALVKIAEEVTDLVREYGGALSGEHGDGRVRTPLLERFYGPELMGAFREIKAIFDPRNLLNPGNIVDPAPTASIVVGTRLNPSTTPDRLVEVPEVDTYFDYSDQHGFDAAVEMCNGAGVCRKKQGGTMCPSYMALLDERHSTRGRGNALRLAITGQLGGAPGAPTWDDAETIKTLDLCLSCKACKSECPSNVDIARLKAEYTAQRHRQKGGAPLAARVFANVRRLNRLGSKTPRLANWMNRRGLVRAVVNRALGLAPQRSLPEFAPSLYDWFERRERAGAGAGRARKVVLFADCFAAYNEPGVGRAAVRVLEALGYEVLLPGTGCCSRPMISLGLLEQARAEGGRTLDALIPLAQREDVEAVLVLEPSCLSAFKDDLLKLKLKNNADARHELARKSWLVEDFVEMHWDSHPVWNGVGPAPPFAKNAPARPGPPVLLHGHCHQKALWGAETSAALLRRLVGDRLVVLDSGCCGMAGSFGFTADRYDLSMKIGELSLLPAARSAPADAVIAAPGTSCRHQTLDGASRRALHPIEVAAGILLGEHEENT